MLIVYLTKTGEVVDNSGTSDAQPDGPPDELAYVNTDPRGIDRAELSLLRLHDVDAAAAVQLALTRRVRVVDGALVDAGAIPTAPATPGTPRIDRAELRAAAEKATTVAQLRAVVLQLVEQ